MTNKPRLSDSEWAKEIAEYKASGKGVKAYSYARGLSPSALYRQLEKEKVKEQEPGKFVAVGSSKKITLELRNGAQVTISREDLSEVLGALK